MQKYTLVPKSFFEEDKAYDILSETVQLNGTDEVKYQELPEYQAVLVYAGNPGTPANSGNPPSILNLIRSLVKISDYNKVAVKYSEGRLEIAAAAGDKLLIANSYPAENYVTGEYFIFAATKKFQMNPAQTVLYFEGDAPFKMKNDLIRYFKGLERLK